MIEFAWPWLFLALPLPLLVAWRLRAAQRVEEAALRIPFIDDFAQHGAGRPQGASRFALILATLLWLLLVGAAARPVWYGEPVELPVSGRDLMLAVDLSGSMVEQDFDLGGKVVNRLQAVKQVAGEFIERRVGDRLGLILFGSQPYVQVPLTFDRESVRTLLDEALIGLAGKETAIGDAIGLAVKRLEGQPAEEQQVLILLTDGANTTGTLEPLKAAELAAEAGLKIYTIGIGADEMIVRTLFGVRKVNPARDLDETTLKGIAEKTGGRYFRARDTEELGQIYELLDQLEPVVRETQSFRPQRSLFHWPLGGAFGLALLLLWWQNRPLPVAAHPDEEAR